MAYKEHWEERAANYLTTRNNLVRLGAYENSPLVNHYEERAANCLSRAKGK